METANQQHGEGEMTKAIENQTAKLPSDFYLGAAVAAMGVSLLFKITAKDDKALFFGQWVAPFLLFGIYNKIVKTVGSE
nr:hypothetical protein [uncultured Mucilaginibacter sp.]